MKILRSLLLFLCFCSCNIQESLQSLGANDSENSMVKEIPQTVEDDWQFMGVYTGVKEEAYNQKLSYKLYLWQLNNKYQGYIYYLWYVTDFNYGEYQSLLRGKKKKKQIILKGNFDNEPVLVTIHDSIQPHMEISLRYPTNFGASVNRVSMTLDDAMQKTLPTSLNGEIAMKKMQGSLMQAEMAHRGY